MRITFYRRATKDVPGRLQVQCGDEIYIAEHDIRDVARQYNGDPAHLSDMAFRAMKEKITAQLWASAQQGRY